VAAVGDPDQRAALLSGVPLEELLQELGEPRGLHRRGRRFPCPDTGHEQSGKTPPASVFTGRHGQKLWWCHSCDKGGTAIDALVAAGHTEASAFAELRRRVGWREGSLERPRAGRRPSSSVNPRGRRTDDDQSRHMAAFDGVPKELRDRWSNGGIDISHHAQGLILDDIRLPPHVERRGRIDNALSEVLEYADVEGLPVAVTPQAKKGQPGERAQQAWLEGHGFRENSGPNRNDAFLQTLIRDPVIRQEQVVPAVAANAHRREVSDRAAALSAPDALQQDPLERYRERDDALWIGRRAAELGSHVAQRKDDWLRERRGQADRALARAPDFEQLADRWIRGPDGERAARAVALRGELARRERGAPATGREPGEDPAGLDRWVQVPNRYRELLDDKYLSWLERRASELRVSLEGRPDLQEQRQTTPTVDAAFSGLDRHAAEVAAWDVAIQRELSAREQMGAAVRAAKQGGIPASGIATLGDSAEELEAKLRRCLGNERAEPILKHAKALERDTKAMGDAAELWAARLGDPLDELDVDAALACRRTEAKERAKRAETRREEVLGRQAQAKANGHTGRWRAQRQHIEAVRAHRRNVEALTSSLSELAGEQQELLASGRHPDQWIQKHADRAARAIAASTVLEQERSVETTIEPESGPALDQPVREHAERELVATAELGPGL
jgi:hypothetical protein